MVGYIDINRGLPTTRTILSIAVDTHTANILSFLAQHSFSDGELYQIRQAKIADKQQGEINLNNEVNLAGVQRH